ncbi:MAG: thioredoxin [Ruminococcaceae bacterium]|nr:thioredoxin [Oscillospiraceae bacterium]
MKMAEVKLTAEAFSSEVLCSDRPVIIDFWATWCGPCKMIAPVIAEIAEEHPEWKVCKVDVDEEGTLAARFGINSIPTVLLIKEGRTVATSVGYLPKADLLKALGLE